jgi:hypothetical protein
MRSRIRNIRVTTVNECRHVIGVRNASDRSNMRHCPATSAATACMAYFAANSGGHCINININRKVQ